MQILLFNDLILIDCSQNNPLFFMIMLTKERFLNKHYGKFFLTI